MNTQALLDRVSTLLDQAGVVQGSFAHAPSGVHMLRLTATTGQDATVYRPLLCLVLQGAKEVGTQAKTLNVADGQSLLVSHTVPVVSRITEAARDRPYVALVLPLEIDLLRSLAPGVTSPLVASAQDAFSISLCPTKLEMEDALLRYLQQCERDDTHRLLAPITRREIHARLLMGPHAEQLQKLLWHETSASRIFQATRAIQTDLSRPLAVGDLARRAAMSSSAFFEHFKAVTGTSPLQYQKELRLLHAREALRSSNQKVSDVAFRVGYESASQFSREYTRKFGRPPKVDRDATA
ncbi:AraC family transcriptional regulator [Comamonadaceae bacterium G21597-S1]|nr:AraC family transcriptional regulator [Comamonadaceae bacterium G21597-S1]